jgi:hypothetical protein
LCVWNFFDPEEFVKKYHFPEKFVLFIVLDIVHDDRLISKAVALPFLSKSQIFFSRELFIKQQKIFYILSMIYTQEYNRLGAVVESSSLPFWYIQNNAMTSHSPYKPSL